VKDESELSSMVRYAVAVFRKTQIESQPDLGRPLGVWEASSETFMLAKTGVVCWETTRGHRAGRIADLFPGTEELRILGQEYLDIGIDMQRKLKRICTSLVHISLVVISQVNVT
jgi:hypothetical protein